MPIIAVRACALQIDLNVKETLINSDSVVIASGSEAIQ